MYKKAAFSFNKAITVATVIIITIIILMEFWAALVPEIQTAGNSMNASNRCTDVGCFYNTTTATGSGYDGDCSNNASDQRLGCSTSAHAIPLAALFSGDGVVLILVMVMLLLIIFAIVLVKKKK